jgi:serine/threonine protein kinase
MTPRPSIAHYRIGSKLGQGGMGEVCCATDTKLGRDVAIKILPDAFAQSPDRLVRFTREARVLASLNHPNIAAIYGVQWLPHRMGLSDNVISHAPCHIANSSVYTLGVPVLDLGGQSAQNFASPVSEPIKNSIGRKQCARLIPCLLPGWWSRAAR